MGTFPLSQEAVRHRSVRGHGVVERDSPPGVDGRVNEAIGLPRVLAQRRKRASPGPLRESPVNRSFFGVSAKTFEITGERGEANAQRQRLTCQSEAAGRSGGARGSRTGRPLRWYIWQRQRIVRARLRKATINSRPLAGALFSLRGIGRRLTPSRRWNLSVGRIGIRFTHTFGGAFRTFTKPRT